MQHDGSETLSLAGTSQRETLTSAASPMSALTTCEDTPKLISSPGLADGLSPCGSLAGPTIAASGLAVARASASAASAPRMTTGESGTGGGASSRSLALQSSLESRLREVLDLSGSPEFLLSWRTISLPSGRQILGLAASARRISESGAYSWPWATPKASDGEKASALSKARQGKRRPDNLPGQVRAFLGVTGFAGALSPELSCWLMGFPDVWLTCAASETPLFPRWSPSSSQQPTDR